MFQPIVHTHLHLESTFLRSLFYRFKFRDFTCISSRNFHGKPSRENKQSPIKPVENENPIKSFGLFRSWKLFHFPPSRSLFRSDLVDQNEWSLVYRLKWSMKTVYLVVYGHVLALIGSLFLFYSILVKGKKFYSKNLTNQSYVNPALLFASSMIIAFSILIFRSFTKLIIRGYYSPKYQRFMFIRPNLLAPWKVRKLIVAPGVIEPIPSTNLKFIQPNFKVKGTTAYIFERNFFYPAYYNVLCGFSSPKSISSIQYDPDETFKLSLKEGI